MQKQDREKITDELFNSSIGNLIEDIEVDKEDISYDVCITFNSFLYSDEFAVKWLERHLSVFPGIRQFLVTKNPTRKDMETLLSMANGTSMMTEFMKKEIWIHFNMFTDSVSEIEKLRRLLLTVASNQCYINFKFHYMVDTSWQDFHDRIVENVWDYRDNTISTYELKLWKSHLDEKVIHYTDSLFDMVFRGIVKKFNEEKGKDFHMSAVDSGLLPYKRRVSEEFISEFGGWLDNSCAKTSTAVFGDKCSTYSHYKYFTKNDYIGKNIERVHVIMCSSVWSGGVHYAIIECEMEQEKPPGWEDYEMPWFAAWVPVRKLDHMLDYVVDAFKKEEIIRKCEKILL